MKKIKLCVSKNSYCNISPLVDEDNEPLNLDTLELSTSLQNKLWEWQNEYSDDSSYSWSDRKKLRFEKYALELVEELLLELPRDVQFSYYSELFRTEIEF